MRHLFFLICVFLMSCSAKENCASFTLSEASGDFNPKYEPEVDSTLEECDEYVYQEITFNIEHEDCILSDFSEVQFEIIYSEQIYCGPLGNGHLTFKAPICKNMDFGYVLTFLLYNEGTKKYYAWSEKRNVDLRGISEIDIVLESDSDYYID